MKERSLPVRDLAEEVGPVRRESGDTKGWTNTVRRTAGRNNQRTALEDRRLELETRGKPRTLAHVGQLL